jgi:CubicO group peptidase (beta-lactamase class C family)
MYPDGGCFENKYQINQWEFIQEDKANNWIAAALHTGMRKNPGEEWAYCSFGYVVLGEIISRVSGEFANDYIMNHIVKPCGLKDTGFDYKKDIVVRMNIPHERREKMVKEFLTETYKDEDDGTVWKKIPSTGGGLYSTAYDLCRFGIMLQQGGYIDGNRILGRKAIEKMSTLYTQPHIKDYCWNAGGPYRQYGLGPDMRCNDASIYTQGTFFHEGAGGCCLLIDPTEKMVAAWFIPFIDDVWSAEPLYNAAAVMWSGII